MIAAERLLQVSQSLPEPALAELLEFAELLQKKHVHQPAATGRALIDLQGGLEHSSIFAGDPLAIQSRLRDEWH